MQRPRAGSKVKRTIASPTVRTPKPARFAVSKPARKPLKAALPATPATPLYPMRINKYLALKGHATRRDADELISKKRVFINGRVAELGDKVMESDNVELRQRGTPTTYTYLAFHKPMGTNTHEADSNEAGEESIQDSLSPELRKLHLFPVGRLDKNSHGLLILTNDGRITDRLLNPKYAHEKSYDVKTKMPLRASFKEYMEKGVDIEGYITQPAKVQILSESRFRITLTEGKTHQVRRMVVAMHNEVADLKRTSIMNITLGTLKTNSYRELEETELKEFLNRLGL